MGRCETKKFLVLILSITLLPLIFSCAGLPSVSTQAPASAPAPNTQNLVDGVISIGANQYYEIKFTVNTTTMRSVKVVGTFKASGGSGNDIEVLIVDDTAFSKWTQGHNVPNIYYSGKLTASSINITMPNSGGYHLIFDNSFSLISSKEVTAKVDLVWSG